MNNNNNTSAAVNDCSSLKLLWSKIRIVNIFLFVGLILLSEDDCAEGFLSPPNRFVSSTTTTTTSPSHQVWYQSLKEEEDLLLKSTSTRMEEGVTTTMTEDSSSIRPLEQNWWPVTTLSCLDPKSPNPIQVMGNSLVLLPEEDSFEKWKCIELSTARRFPIQIAAGLVWVWTDAALPPPNSELPISPLLQRWHQQSGNEQGEYLYVRDVFCSMDALMETFMDISRLPYVHHSLGGLDRKRARQVTMTMIDTTTIDDTTPLLRAQVDTAWETDPVYVTAAASGEDIPTNATSTVSFYPPHHIRIERRKVKDTIFSSVYIFLTPLEKGRTRIFYSQIFGDALMTSTTKNTNSWIERVFVTPKSVRNHMFLHQLMDGDILLTATRQQQQNQNKQEEITSSADVLGHTYRHQYWNQVRKLTTMKDTNSLYPSSSSTTTVVDRRSLLDRRSHTCNVRICKEAEEREKRFHRRLGRWRTNILAMVGASQFFSSMMKMMLLKSSSTSSTAAILAAIVQPILIKSTVLLTLATVLVSYWKRLVQRNIQKFTFEEYVRSNN